MEKDVKLQRWTVYSKIVEFIQATFVPILLAKLDLSPE